MAILRQYRLRLHLGRGWTTNRATQVAVATALVTASRAFLGGLVLSGDRAATFSIPVLSGKSPESWLREANLPCDQAEDDVPTLVFGSEAGAPNSDFALKVESSGWVAKVHPIGEARVSLPGDGIALAAAAAAAIGVNEAFLRVRSKSRVYGSRSVGLSLWRPEVVDGYESADFLGPSLRYLPSRVWLIGLGHLGQSYSWLLSQLPFVAPGKVQITLQDYDRVSLSNCSTGVLVNSAAVGQYKTRLVADVLENIGFRTAILERPVCAGQEPLGDEPRLALVGVDNVHARRLISCLGFETAIECGLGSGFKDFQAIRMHTFPCSRLSSDVWKAEYGAVAQTELSANYKRLAEATGDECGVTQLAGRAVGAPFVGVFAGALVLADAVRTLHGGRSYALADLSMRDIANRTLVERDQHYLRHSGITEAAA